MLLGSTGWPWYLKPSGVSQTRYLRWMLAWSAGGVYVGMSSFSLSFLPESASPLPGSTLHISVLEMQTVVPMVKVWIHQLRRAKIKVCCNNEATVYVVDSGRDAFMQSCLREMCYITTKAQCIIQAMHLPGVLNRLPDLLSLNPQARVEFRELTAHQYMTQIHILKTLFEFSQHC